MPLKKITFLSILTAFALGLFALELLLPPFPMCPSAKIGLANIVTLFLVSHKEIFSEYETALVIVSRCLLAALVTGRISAVLFSFCGGMLALAAMLLFRKYVKRNIIAVSICGAVFHNIGQILVSVLFYGVLSVFYTVPMLMIAGILSGALTGACVLFINRNNALNLYIAKNIYKDKRNGKS